MKQLFVLFAFVAATAAHATTVKVDSVDAVYQSSSSSYEADVTLDGFKFEVNPEMGRARIDVLYAADISCGGDDACYGPGDSEVLVSGLSFDTERSQVVYKNADGKLTACATVTISQGIFGRKTKVKNTGLCTLSSAIEDIASDDGWEIKHRKVLNVFLNVQE